MTETIEINDRQAERFENLREQWSDEHTPEPTDSQMVSSLLDTVNAVESGFYTEDHTPNEELRELVEAWRDEPGLYNPEYLTDQMEYAVQKECADELERVLEDHNG